MVGKASERLQDHERSASLFRVMEDLRRDQYALARIKCMMDDRIAFSDQILHPAGRTVQGMAFCDPVRHIMGQ